MEAIQVDMVRAMLSDASFRSDSTTCDHAEIALGDGGSSAL